MTTASLYRLMSWLSPSFPVGAFSYSHGLEAAVEAGSVADAGALADWVHTVMAHGAGWNDARLLVAISTLMNPKSGPEAVPGEGATDHLDRIAGVAELAAALQPTAEISAESLNQGRAFVRALSTSWPDEMLDQATHHLGKAGIPIAYPVAVGLACGAFAIPPRDAAEAYLHAFASNIVSAGVRLIPLGQTDGQKVIAGLEPLIGAIADEIAEDLAAAGHRPERLLDALGSATAALDIASMHHETQYSRLFRS